MGLNPVLWLRPRPKTTKLGLTGKATLNFCDLDTGPNSAGLNFLFYLKERDEHCAQYILL